MIKTVFTWSPRERKLRLFRFTYAGKKKQITFGIQPYLLRFRRMWGGWKFWVLGLVIHWHRAGGGYFPD